MKIVTWNINSVRLRIETVLQMAREDSPDVICLQETKTPDEFFPVDAFKDAGYEHLAFKGMKGYNGVAFVSKTPLNNFKSYQRCSNDDCRHISVEVKKDGLDAPIELHNLYIPAGGYDADPILNPKFQHKLDFVDELTKWFPANVDKSKPVIAMGDMNIAPMEHDVWSHKQLLKVVSHTPEETTRFESFYQSMDFVDAIRKFVPEDEKLYTWWSYRAKDWLKADKGRRLDHMWVTKSLEPLLKSHKIRKDIRGWERPSDHAPVILELK